MTNENKTLTAEELKQANIDLISVLRECAMRANVSMPETEEDMEHFEEQFSGNPDFALKLFKILKLGNFDESFKKVVASEEMEPVINSAVYGMCPKCNENMTRCACSLPSWDDIVKKSEDKKQKQINQLQSDLTSARKEIEELKGERDRLKDGVLKIKAVAESHLQLPKETISSYCDQILNPTEEGTKGEGYFKTCPTCTDSVNCSLIQICQHPLGNF